MLVREWSIPGAKPHTVRLEHRRLFSGKARVLLDGQVVYERGGFTFWDTGFECRFLVDGLPCIVRALYRTWHYEYELWIDGKLQ